MTVEWLRTIQGLIRAGFGKVNLCPGVFSLISSGFQRLLTSDNTVVSEKER